jgi:hypothetical protein
MASERATGLTSHLGHGLPQVRSSHVSLPDWVDTELNNRSWHLSISSAYVIAWIVVAVVWQRAIFSGTNIGLFIVLYVVTGLSLASWTQLVAVPFAAAPTLAAITGTSNTCEDWMMKLKYSNFLGDHPCYRCTTIAQLGRCTDHPHPRVPSDVLYIFHESSCCLREYPLDARLHSYITSR